MATQSFAGRWTTEGWVSMPTDQHSSLSDLSLAKLPLRYGMDSCYITLTDDRYAEETIQLRNTAALGIFVNSVALTLEAHEYWLAQQLERDDALNFVLVAKQKFAGTLSLYNIEHGQSGELGRMMMPDDGRRIYALAAEILAVSFAFEILGLRMLYCVTMEANKNVLNSHLKYGWRTDPRFDRLQTVNGRETHLLGLSMEHSEWRKNLARVMPLAKRLFRP